jgi:hypothetical protein
MNGKGIIDFKGKWIKWALDFVQTDLNSLTKSRLRGLCCEVFYFASSQFGLERGFERVLLQWPFDKLPQIQITNFNEATLGELRKLSPDEWERMKRIVLSVEELERLISQIQVELPRIQVALSDFLKETQNLSECMEYVIAKPGAVVPPPPIKHFVGWITLPETESQVSIVGLNLSSPYWDLNVVPIDGSYTKWAILNFANLLMRGLSMYAIRRCKGCTRYFLNLSLREKIYCNPACASRSIARMKREELKRHPRKYKAYLKKQNEYTMKRYLKMRQAQFGPNVKIGRKVRRRKED